MTTEIAQGPNRGRENRVPAAATGTPRCGNCHCPVTWVATAGEFAAGAAPAAAPRTWVEDAPGKGGTTGPSGGVA